MYFLFHIVVFVAIKIEFKPMTLPRIVLPFFLKKMYFFLKNVKLSLFMKKNVTASLFDEIR